MLLSELSHLLCVSLSTQIPCAVQLILFLSLLFIVIVIIVDTMAMFGIEFIIVFTALLLKKRIAIYHSDVPQLLSVCR